MNLDRHARPDRSSRFLLLAAIERKASLLQFGLIVGLFLLALVPRLLMAWKIDVLCNDGALYVQIAQQLEKGDYRRGFQELGLNAFPLMLYMANRVGLDCIQAGQLGNVLFAAAVVLPLFGWLSRQFDRRIAASACVLYAVHPALIEWSPELIRDPLFWLLGTSSVYFFWRAVHEERLVIFAVAGLALAASVFTRVEGLFLAFVLLLWAAWRSQEMPRQSWRIATGCACCFAVGPLILVALNLLLLSDHPPWEWFRTVPLSLAADWIARSPETASLSLTQRLWLYARAWESGVTPIYAVLIGAGIACRLRVWWRAEHQAISLFGGAIALSMWIHLWAAGQSSERYVLFLLILLTPWASLALLNLGLWLEKKAVFTPPSFHRWVFAGSLLTAISAVGVVDALTTTYESRRARANLGTWVNDRYGVQATVVGTKDIGKLVAHYARGNYHCLSTQPTSKELAHLIARRQPTVIMLSASGLDAACSRELRGEASRWGFVEEQGPDIKTTDYRVMILVKCPAVTRH